MIENVKGFEFGGAAFSEKTAFTFFPSENDRMCLINAKKVLRER